MYCYKFNNGCTKPSGPIPVCDSCPDGFITFGDGSPVDWTKYSRDITTGELVAIPEKVNKYCYSNNGFSYVLVDENYVAQTGEVLFDVLATESELTAAFTDRAAVVKQQEITALNQEYAQKIISKEKLYAAVVTSSLYTESEVAALIANIKADKLAIYQELKTKQEAIING